MQLFNSAICHLSLLAVNVSLVSLQLKYYYWTSHKLEYNMWKISKMNWLDIIHGILIKIINFNSDSKTSYYNTYSRVTYSYWITTILLLQKCTLIKKKIINKNKSN